MISVVVFTILLCLASARAKVKEETRTAFSGEDLHLLVSSLKTTEVIFKPNVGPEEVLMRDGKVESSRAKLNPQFSHLILENLGEPDEGVYTIKRTNAEEVKHVTLQVRDCVIEENRKYGENYYISLSNISGPITVEFRPSSMQTNQTSEPMVLLLNQSWTPTEEYKARVSVSGQRLSLHSVTGSDEGSYTILDSEGKVKRRTCLNVKEHQIFVTLRYDSTLKVNLILDSSKVRVVYTPVSDHKDRLILDQGELVPTDPSLDRRLSVDGSICILEQVRFGDSGQFQVMDLQGFPVANVHVRVEAYKLPMLFVSIISLLSLLVFLLLVCLISCLVKVRRRAERARAIARIARQAGKGDGEAFRQVVHEAYTRFTEESSTRSQWDSNTDNTIKVDIKGLEISKPSGYQTLPSEKNFLDFNDSGVEFNISDMPLDSDTDMPQTYNSHKFLLASNLPNGAAKQSPEAQPNGSPLLEPRADVSPEAGKGSSESVGMAAPPEATPSDSPAAEVNEDAAPPSDSIANQNAAAESVAV
ncbi:uncharacterized protein LOC118796623 isoform X1 [Megalops cyprinoides]|uniref:uncharacterized protein LOC118796623 isoform X1 n=2 Tax=Megalops cyprinoides TaxID=118141 RepID=UPI001864A9ED|nr:uncharacterized protein LOC118796623 isoform X1 [Megalops cyprinoides]